MKNLLAACILLCISMTAFAQKGYLRGKVIDSETGEALIGATVSKKGTTIGAVVDFNGNYSLALEPGMHNVVYQFISYQTKTVENIEIKAGEVSTLDISMSSTTETLQEVVVSAEAARDSDIAILTLQKKSANLMDGISSQTFRKTGDSNLSGAMKRVTGVSVQGGRYVYVRGLGDRYTKTTLNGLSIPGLDPERNDVQIDIFPTSVLENVMVYKTFTPDMQGDFTGGTVDIETKSFPEEKTTAFSVGTGLNPHMNLNNDFVYYKGGSLDFLGFDDGTRKLPFNKTLEIPDESLDDPALTNITRSFSPQLAAQRKTSFLNTSFSFNHGNQIDKGNHDLGYAVILNYQNKFEYYDDAEYGNYTKDEENYFDLTADKRRKGNVSSNNVLWSALLSGAIKYDNREFAASILHTQNGIATTADRTVRDLEETGQTIYQDVLSYTQRSITNNILSGKHNYDKFKLEWANSFTYARVYDPDYRVTEIAVNEIDENTTQYSISGGQGGNAARFFRDLNEMNENFKVDVTYPLKEKDKLKFGASALLKWRNFEINNYLIRHKFVFEDTERSVDPDPNWLFEEENVWTPESETGTYVSGNIEEANNYEARSAVYAGYAMADMYFTKDLRAIYGVRAELSNMHYTGQNNFGTIVYDDKKTLDELDILPAVNLVYSLSETMNLRVSYGRTLARPSFKEKSIAQILDPITGRTFLGNIDLEETIINNYDIRLENFFGKGEMFSVSGYYKQFNGHIELTSFENLPNHIKPRNIGGSFVYGVEFEIRKNLNFINGLSIGSNVSFTKSEVDMTEVVITDTDDQKTEYESRLENAANGETVSKTRDMGGQAPFLINAYLNFSNTTGDININLSYNVQGESLQITGIGNVPDVYSTPFDALNFNIYKDFGPERKSRLTLGVDNILNDTQKDIYKSFGSNGEISAFTSPGREFSIKYAYTF